MPITLATPLSLYSIPIVWFVGFYPHNRRYALIDRTIGWDNVNPRSNTKETLLQKGMAPELVQRAANLAGAHQNGFEIFPLWAAAVLTANFVGVDHSTVNIVSGAFIGLRLLFNYVYINQDSKAKSGIRTLLWFVGALLPHYLLVKSANKARIAGI
ncbi:hypothetical protein M422DRAFT_209565 [Sphaerobolus stellatus SS14]|uniref:Uncharacterized protein n=1 Tax=Sphaerobolus stellatus (strain SS14) TaxID=990650 RepID=A0A0C9V275_SPHS4|nr:hypothetical protein M422DRAFT_209565 [Sphaerobolus stellatus SS14]